MKKIIALRVIGFFIWLLPYFFAIMFLIDKGWITDWFGIVGGIVLLALLVLGAAKLLTLKKK